MTSDATSVAECVRCSVLFCLKLLLLGAKSKGKGKLVLCALLARRCDAMRCDAVPQDEQESIELKARTLLALEKVRELKSEVSRRQRDMEIRRREKVSQRLLGRERLPWAIWVLTAIGAYGGFKAARSVEGVSVRFGLARFGSVGRWVTNAGSRDTP